MFPSPRATVAQALKDAERRVRDVTKAMSGTGATDRCVKSLSGLKLSARDIETVASAWKDYSRSARLAADSTKWTKAQAADVRAWERQQVAALRSVKREQAAFVRAQARAAEAPKGGGVPAVIGGGLRTMAGVAVGYAAAQKAKDVVDKYRAADSTLRYQGAMAELTPDEMASRAKRAYTLGPRTGMKPTDILHAQQTLAGRGVKKQFVEPFTEELTNYARAMKTDLEASAKTLETIIFSTNQHIDNAGEAAKTMRRQIDIAVKAAKLGGLDDADIQMGAKFGAAAGHAGGFKNETIFGIMAALSRAGYRGDEAGVAARAIASTLVSPKAKGLDALSAMGIDYNKFTTLPGGLSPENLESMLNRRFGKRFSEAQKGKLRELFENNDLIGNREEFIPQVSGVIEESVEKNKKGRTKAQDAQKIAKLAGDFYKLSTESVDVEALLTGILEKHPALQQLNALFTSQHAGRGRFVAQGHSGDLRRD
jgi:TP901 family phage tail tape measure protein